MNEKPGIEEWALSRKRIFKQAEINKNIKSNCIVSAWYRVISFWSIKSCLVISKEKNEEFLMEKRMEIESLGLDVSIYTSIVDKAGIFKYYEIRIRENEIS